MRPREKTDTIVIHCTQTPPDMDIGAEEINKWHKNRGFDTIGYHFVITRSGAIEKGRDISREGAHASRVNGTSIGIALVGGADKDMEWENNFNEVQFVKLKELIEELQSKYMKLKIIGHYEVDDHKKCPSFDVPEWLKENGLA